MLLSYLVFAVEPKNREKSATPFRKAQMTYSKFFQPVNPRIYTVAILG